MLNKKQRKRKLFDARYVNYDKLVALVHLGHVLPVGKVLS